MALIDVSKRLSDTAFHCAFYILPSFSLLYSWWVLLGFSVLFKAQDNVDQYQDVQDSVIQIRDQPCVTGGNNPDAVPEALIIPLQFLFACAEDREIPVAHKLDDEPEEQDAKENPLSGWMEAVERDDAEGVQAEHEKLGALYADASHKNLFPDPVGDSASQEPDP